MRTLDFFKGLEDPIKKKETIDKLVECYEDSYKSENERYSHNMYSKIVRYGIDNKLYGQYNVEQRDYFELYNFNKWKNSILRYPVDKIKEEYKEGFRKLQYVLRKSNPKNYQEVNQILENFKEVSQGKYDELIKDEKYKEVLELVKYTRLGEFSGWDHISSNYTKFNSGKIYPVHHRFYINTDSTFTHYFAKLFMQECDSRKIDYYYKIDIVGNRSDTMVVYCSDENLLTILEILKKIKREHQELRGHLHRPPFLTSNIDNWIGYGTEPSVKDGDKLFSYNSLRTKVIDESMTKLNKEWLKQNKDNVVILNGRKSPFIDYIAEKVFEEQIEKFEKSASWSWPKDEVEFAKRNGFARKYVKDPKFRGIYKRYVKSQIIKIMNNLDNYKQSDIDDLKGYSGTSIKLEKDSIEKALRKMLYIARANDSNFDDKLRKEMFARGEQYHLFSQNIAFDSEYVYSAINKEREQDNQSSTSTGQRTVPKRTQQKKTQTPKQYTYKPMTDAEISATRRHVGL